MVLECAVTGLTAKLQTVKWTKVGGSEVSNGVTGYTFVEGAYDKGAQTTTLTVASAKLNMDSVYNCVITPAAQDDPTEVTTPVELNVYCM